MDKQEIYKDILDEMCAPGDYIREVLRHSFTDGKDVCASDTHWLLRVKPEAVNLPDVPKGPKRIEVDYNVDLTLNIAEIDSMVKAVDTEEEEVEISPAITCDECNGDGEVEFEYESKDFSHYYADCECPICKGTGESTPARYRKTGRKNDTDISPGSIIEWSDFVRIQAFRPLGCLQASGCVRSQGYRPPQK